MNGELNTSDSAVELQQRIHDNIPLSKHMAFHIQALDCNSIRVTAPLEPNVNIHDTGFAGSLYSLAVLTGWALCTHIIDGLEPAGDIVVGKAEIRYRKPVNEDIDCRCSVSDEQRESFIEDFLNRGKGRLKLKVLIGADNQAVLESTYVGIRV